jgi:hypothetical protein
MNLQASHPHPWLSAIAMDDKRVSKMTLETAQMYCTATGNTTYKPTHQHHPLIPWCQQNLSWLIRFHQALAGEYYFRRGIIHSSFRDVGQHMIDVPDVEPLYFRNHARSPHMSPLYSHAGEESYRLIPIDFTHIQDTHLAYRYYMRARWSQDKRAATWTRRPPPFWLRETPPPNHNRSRLLTQTEITMTSEDVWKTTITEGINPWLKRQRLKKGWNIHRNGRSGRSPAKTN